MTRLLLISAASTIGGCFLIIAGYKIGFLLIAVGVALEVWAAVRP